MKRDLFGTGDPGLLALWDRLLTLQADVTVGFELPAYFTEPAWRRARRVLDVGTGNGAYLRRLARLFPGKDYLGVDRSAELVEAARSAGGGGVDYRCLDAFEVEGSFDFIILRLVVRHVADQDRLVALLDRLLTPGGRALVSDSDGDRPSFWPEAPALSALFRRLDDSLDGRAGDRGPALDGLVSRVRSSPGLRVADRRALVVPSTVAGNLDAMREMYALTLDLIRRTSDWDTAEAESEWSAWCGLPIAFTQFGMELIQLEKTGGPAGPPARAGTSEA